MAMYGCVLLADSLSKAVPASEILELINQNQVDQYVLF